MNKVLVLTVLVLSALALPGCLSDQDKAKEVLKAQGHTEVITTGWQFGCGQDDAFSTGFRSRGPAGQPVSGVVCCGILKGCTTRID